MKSLKDYGNHFLDGILDLKISPLEITLIAALALMCLMSAIDYNREGEMQGLQQLHVARQQAQQELMALRSPIQPN
ncbi:hypothetical protein [Vampirovibrio sp.]|uniref:hypothetical protein n=1 Tax=Vampirovibrio sp. TaxID=2717857 RepID=UPI00359376F2